MPLDLAAGVQKQDGQTFTVRVEMRVAGNVHPPIIGCFVGRLAKLQVLRRRTFPQGGHFVFIRAGGKLERFDQCFKSGKNWRGIHGSFSLSSGLHVGGKIGAVFAARVLGVRGVRRTRPARVLPHATALIPMEAQTVKRVRGSAVAGLGKLKPYPFADNLGQFVLLRQLRPQVIQNLLRRQFAVGVVFSHPLGAG